MAEATRLGHRLFRNNTGVAAYFRGGREYRVPYGIGGKGGSDLIGFTSRSFGEGIYMPIFTVVEGKGRKTTTREGQDEFIEMVRRFGGIAGKVKSVSDYRKLIGAE